MDKYQEALNVMRNTIQEIDMRNDTLFNNEVSLVISATTVLQELVDLHTPMVIKITNNNEECPKCRSQYSISREQEVYSYCSYCGQALDWWGKND